MLNEDPIELDTYRESTKKTSHFISDELINAIALLIKRLREQNPLKNND